KDGTECHVVAGGQKCGAAASNDTATALLALDASIVLARARGVRTPQARNFYTADGIPNTVRAGDGVVGEAAGPARPGRAGAYEKLRRRASIDFPLLSVAARADMDERGRVAALDVVVSALAARPRRLAAAQKLEPGRVPSEELVRSLAQASHRECH